MPLLSFTRRLEHWEIVGRLRQESHELTATSFAFFGIEFDLEIATELVQVFRNSAKNGRILIELGLYFCPGNQFIDHVLQVAVDLDIFWHFHIKGTHTVSDTTIIQRMQQQTIEENAQDGPENSNFTSSWPSLRPFGLPLQFCRNLRRLQLSCLTLSRDDMQLLRKGLAATRNDDGNNTDKIKGTFPRRCKNPSSYWTTWQRRLIKLSISNSVLMDGAVEVLGAALHDNRSLQDIALVSCGLGDQDIETIIRSLYHHASLSTLRLYGNKCHRRGSHAIVFWLSQDDCTLASLQISHQNRPTNRNRQTNGLTETNVATTAQQQINNKLQLEHFVQAWYQPRVPTTPSLTIVNNRSLRQLRLNGNNLSDEDMQFIGPLLSCLTMLEELDLDSNNITDEGLHHFASHDDTSNLQLLRLSGNPLTTAASLSLLTILRKHPGLGSVTSNDFWKKHRCMPRIRHFLDINGAGRMLLQRHSGSGQPINNHGTTVPSPNQPYVPLSLWPVVLARVNRGIPMSHLNFGCKDDERCLLFVTTRSGADGTKLLRYQTRDGSWLETMRKN
ncbi:leucine rich repeat LRR-containing protein [Nitzschia inconspicua]|uniref:Leucine rich repeat LRR-containing protein n=1 Tax=Nitzschia inconspicua TaxID=303405 RepID=A0A9K3KIX9_9STRA|nr:leucine rich repeat LRR-containing protein [Nitzschia inconspicua]